MSKTLKLAVAGVGRMGQIHALHVQELARETGKCTLAALIDPDAERARQVAAGLHSEVPIFVSLPEFAKAGIADATVVVTPTADHRENAETLIATGQRILLEKPLTGTLAGDSDFCAQLDRDSPNALMLGFQRRFDAPYQYARELMQSGAIGRVFKIYSAMEDSNPPPNSYSSGGILSDMSVHNVDEILWLMGRMPRAALAIGSRIYSHALTTCGEDFDDALLYLWFADETVAQVQVSRNHVSGYRVETLIFGQEGHIQVGHFNQKRFEIVVEAFGRRGCKEPLARRVFEMRDYGRPLPEFIDRFGPAYKSEVAAFVDCCLSGAAFPTSHRDGLRAQQVISAGMQAMITPARAASVLVTSAD